MLSEVSPVSGRVVTVAAESGSPFAPLRKALDRNDSGPPGTWEGVAYGLNPPLGITAAPG